jgi:hypothetical protein
VTDGKEDRLLLHRTRRGSADALSDTHLEIP